MSKFIDRTGQKYGQLTFIEATSERDNQGQIIWKLLCECGNYVYRIAGPIVHGHSNSCNCNKGNNINYTGQRYRKLVFIKKLDNYTNEYGNTFWEVMCDCGKLIPMRPSDVYNGGKTNCGCSSSIEKSKRQKHNEPRIASATVVFNLYKNRDKRAGAEFNISFEEFLIITQQNCFYCGTLPYNTYNIIIERIKAAAKRNNTDPKLAEYHQKELQEGNFTYNGMDRIDSSKGHINGNIVPCCWTCNRMKGKMSHQEFIAHIARIHIHQQSSTII